MPACRGYAAVLLLLVVVYVGNSTCRTIGVILSPEFVTSAQEAAAQLGGTWRITTGTYDYSRIDNVTESIYALCSILASTTDLVGVIGHEWSSVSQIVAPILGAHQVPLISPSATATFLSNAATFPYFARTIPPDSYQGQAMLALLAHFKWARVGILFHDDVYSTGLANEIFTDNTVVVRYSAILHDDNNDYAEEFSALNREGIRIVLLIADSITLSKVLKRGIEAGMVGVSDQVWIVPDSVSTINLFTEEGDNAAKLRKQSLGLLGIAPNTALNSALAGDYKTVYMKDAIKALSIAASGVSGSYNAAGCTVAPGVGWSEGKAVMDKLKTVSFEGATGRVEFNGNSDRQPLPYAVVNLQPKGTQDAEWHPVAMWKPVDNQLEFINEIYWPGGGTTTPPPDYPSLRGRKLTIAVKHSAPWIVITETNGEKEINGVLVDFLHALGEVVGIAAKDMTFTEHTEGTWTDLVKLVGSGTSPYDMFVSSVTITSAREGFADFTQPFFIDSLTFLMGKPQTEPSLWGFLDPFNWSLWLLVGCTVLFGAHVFWGLERGVNEYLSTNYVAGVTTAAWFCFTAILQCQDAAPATTAGRVFCTGLYYSGVIVIAAYTANLAAFLSRSNTLWPISNPSDLSDGTAKLTHSQIGISAGTSMSEWWTQSFPGIDPCWMHDSDNDGDKFLEAASSGANDFRCKVSVRDGAAARYTVSTHANCSLASRGSFVPFGYGFVLPLKGPFTEAWSAAILALLEKGWMRDREKVEWQGPCSTATANTANLDELDAAKMGGVFVVLGALSLLSLIVYGVERLYRTRKARKTASPEPVIRPLRRYSLAAPVAEAQMQAERESGADPTKPKAVRRYSVAAPAPLPEPEDDVRSDTSGFSDKQVEQLKEIIRSEMQVQDATAAPHSDTRSASSLH